MGVENKTIGILIDELITTSMKCWHAQEAIMDPTLSDSARLAASERAQRSNAKRSALIIAIDKKLEDSEFTLDIKTYAGK